MDRKTDQKRTSPGPARPSHGLVVGGLGGPEEELLESGQEEVFSRSEVESGRIEHAVRAGGAAVGPDEDETPDGRDG